MASTAPRLWLGKPWQDLLINWQCHCVFAELVQKTVFFQQLIKEASAPCLVCGKKNLLLQTEDCSKGLALARGPCLPAGIAGVANYSADGFIAVFLMGPGLSSFVLRVFLILCPASSCPVGHSLGIQLRVDLLWWQSRSQRVVGRQNRP